MIINWNRREEWKTQFTVTKGIVITITTISIKNDILRTYKCTILVMSSTISWICCEIVNSYFTYTCCTVNIHKEYNVMKIHIMILLFGSVRAIRCMWKIFLILPLSHRIKGHDRLSMYFLPIFCKLGFFLVIKASGKHHV